MLSISRIPDHTPLKSLRRALLFACALYLAGTSAGARDLDVVFVLDTTGSMSGELREVQERVEQLAVALARARADARIRFGIVAFRDRGDAYVTRISELTDNVETSRTFLASLTADGGGDAPESVVAALAAALREMAWDFSDETERQIFLIGDAPPHLDYGDEPTPEELIEEARRSRIVVNAIGCRSLPSPGIEFFRGFAYATEGSYQHIGRVRSPRAGALAEAVSRTVTSGYEEDEGAELSLTWARHEADRESPGILVRQGGPPNGGQGEEDGERCSLEVFLPASVGLREAPRARLGRRGLTVELEVTAGSGGLEVFALEECLPITTPIHVILGGR